MRGQLIFSTHALRRMLKHRIRSDQVREVLEGGERIEEYPDDTPLPSYLVLGRFGRNLHVVAADDPVADETIVITTYEPDPNEWEADLKTRRKP
jgi:hypothetical protein